ncbi:MAG: cation transporter [Clostridia bacterium]|nr:cation transporter [Clostridia bacterium]
MDNGRDVLVGIKPDREKTIIRTGIIGIAANIVLVAFKMTVGLIANSVAVVSDAVNNLSDAVSSIVTIAGTKLAGRRPDREHPLGHGRIEYMTTVVVSAIVLYAGISALVESIKKIISPETANYGAVSMVILTGAVLVKIFLGLYTGRMGKKTGSASLKASGKDALYDALLSGSVLTAAVVFLLTGLSVEAWVSAVISLFIIRTGIGMIRGAVSEMLGTRVSGELSKSIKDEIAKYPEVHGIYDLLVNNYGPGKDIASLHIEVDDSLTAYEIDALTRRLQVDVYRNTGVILAAVGIYSVNTSDDGAMKLKEDIRRCALSHDGVIQFHGFYLDSENKSITYDIVIDYKVKDRDALCAEVKRETEERYPDYSVHVTLDEDLSD